MVCTSALASTRPHSSSPQPGTCCQPTHTPTGAQKTIITKELKKEKRTSPPAFLAAMFQQAWIKPARMTSASALAGTGDVLPQGRPKAKCGPLGGQGVTRSERPWGQHSGPTDDGRGGHQFFQQGQRDFAGDRIRVQLGLFGVLEQAGGVDLGH